MHLKLHCLMTFLMTKIPTKLFFLRRLTLAESSAQVIIRSQLLSASDVGIMAEVKTREPGFIPQECSGGFLPGIRISPSRQPDHTLNEQES